MDKYEELLEILGSDTLVDGINQDGETIILEKVQGSNAIQITTLQKNGWIRRNIYHCDGTTEELYEH